MWAYTGQQIEPHPIELRPISAGSRNPFFSPPPSPPPLPQQALATPCLQQRRTSRLQVEGEEISPTHRRLPSLNINACSDSRPILDTGFYYTPFYTGRVCKLGLNIAREPLQQGINYQFIIGWAIYKCSYCKALYWLEERKINSIKKNPCFSYCADGAISISI
jgi:hypothetical protein